MARQIFINVDTTLNDIQVTDADTATGEVFLDYFGKVGEPLSLERSEVLALTDADAQLKLNTKHGSTGFFKFADIDDVQIDGVTIGAADLADVVTGIGAYIFTSVSGGGTSTSTATFNFATGNQYKSFHRIGWAGSLTAVTPTNVTAYTIYKNGVAITPLVFPIAIAQGDTLFFEVTPTNPAVTASFEFAVSGIANPMTYASLSYYEPIGLDFAENFTAKTNWLTTSDAAIKGNGSAVVHASNVIWKTPVVGDCELIIPSSSFCAFGNRSYWGLNDRTSSDTTSPRYNRTKWSIAMDITTWRVYESGTMMFTVSINNMVEQVSKIEIIGGTVKYYYSTDNGVSWVLAYTSLVAYNGTSPLYADYVASYAYYQETRPLQLKKL